MLTKLLNKFKTCPREKLGYRCHKYNEFYNYYCSECKQSSK